MPGPGLIRARWVALLVPLALLAGALGSQYIGGLYPCEMCHWQRWPHYAAVLVAGASFVVNHRYLRVTLVLIAAGLIALSGAIGVFHAGVEYGWWPGITPCTLKADASANASDLLASVLAGPRVRCDVAQWKLFGISLAGFNAIISIGGAVAILALLGRRRPA